MTNTTLEYPAVSSTELERAIRLIQEDRRLTLAGYGLFGESTLCGHETGEKWLKSRAEIEKLNESRELQWQLYTALRYLEQVTPTKMATARNGSSYKWKHQAERWGNQQGFYGYVSNGIMIVAALMKEFPIMGKGNPWVGISIKSARAIAVRNKS